MLPFPLQFLAVMLAGWINRQQQEAIDLVIGHIGSTDWIHSTHGRKIERALELSKKGAPIAIISEQYWVETVVLA